MIAVSTLAAAVVPAEMVHPVDQGTGKVVDDDDDKDSEVEVLAVKDHGQLHSIDGRTVGLESLSVSAVEPWQQSSVVGFAPRRRGQNLTIRKNFVLFYG